MKTERLNAMTVFFSFHVMLSGFMLFLQVVGVYSKAVFGRYSGQNHFMEHHQDFKWRHVVHAVRQLNLFLFCFLAWVYVLQANDSAGHLALNNNMNIFSGNDACKQEIDSVAPMPAACSLGLSFSNLYSQGSSIRFKAAHEMQQRGEVLATQAAQTANTTAVATTPVATTPVATTPAPSTRR